MKQEVRVRYAPSPTGHLHIGNARTAIFNYLFARANNGKFIVRIEDTDFARNIEGGEASQLNNLAWLGINWDESVDKDGGFGPYRQSERKDIYLNHASQLLRAGQAYVCKCTSEDIESARELAMNAGKAYIHRCDCRDANIAYDGTLPVRFRIDDNADYSFEDKVRGYVDFQGKDISDFVIIKEDNMATYNFAVVVDDALMKISHVIRGEDHIPNTPKQIAVYRALGFELPVFAHASLIVNESRKKLSKRDGHIIQFIEQYKDLGYLPQTLLNFISFLSWTPKDTNEEILSHDELVKHFSIDSLSKAPSFFDVKKLNWINQQYLKQLDDDQFVAFVLPFLEAQYPSLHQDHSDQWVRTLVLAFQEQLQYGAEIIELTKVFFEAKPALDEQQQALFDDEKAQNTIKAFDSIMQERNNEIESLDQVSEIINQTKENSQSKGKFLFMPIRLHLSAQSHGIDLKTLVYLKFSK